MEICIKLLERICCSSILNFGLSAPFNVQLNFAFKLLFNKMIANELFCRWKVGQAHWIYDWNFDILHSFEIICNADIQTWPTSIMWQGKSCRTYRSSLWKRRRFHSNKSVIDLRIWKGRRFENILKSDRNLR